MKPAVNEIDNPNYGPLTTEIIKEIMENSPFGSYGLTDSRTASKYWPQMKKAVEIPEPFLIIAGALPYREWNPESRDEEKLIAPFAACDHYKEAVKLMKGIWKKIREQTGLSSSEGRIFCNSGIPEKELAVLSGMGFTGRNSLHIIGSNSRTDDNSWSKQAGGCERAGQAGEILQKKGSRHVLAFLVFKSELLIPEPSKSIFTCGTCRKCLEACPTGAIYEGGGINRELCIQHHTSRYGKLPDKVQNHWGITLYGCDVCQMVCPYNAAIIKPPYLEPVGLALKSLAQILEEGPEKLEETCRGTSLRFKWIDKKALFRNALLSAGASQDPGLLPLVNRYKNNNDKIIAEVASLSALQISEKQKP